MRPPPGDSTRFDTTAIRGCTVRWRGFCASTIGAWSRGCTRRVHVFRRRFPTAVESRRGGDAHRAAGAARRGHAPGRRPALREIERCGYVDRRAAPDDARATVVRFTARGRRLLATVFDLWTKSRAISRRRSNPASSTSFVRSSSFLPTTSTRSGPSVRRRAAQADRAPAVIRRIRGFVRFV